MEEKNQTNSKHMKCELNNLLRTCKQKNKEEIKHAHAYTNKDQKKKKTKRRG